METVVVEVTVGVMEDVMDAVAVAVILPEGVGVTEGVLETEVVDVAVGVMEGVMETEGVVEGETLAVAVGVLVGVQS